MSVITSPHPQVLLLGNGLNRCYKGDSWDDLLKRITINKTIPADLDCPMPLQAIIRTNDSVDISLKEHQKEFYGSVTSEEHRDLLKRLLGIGFDHILTTNYSYELECAALEQEKGGKSRVERISDYALKKHLSHTDAVEKADGKFNLHTYYEFENGEKQNKIWHIHGEARKPNSIILGHYYYGSLLKRYFQIFDKRKNKYAEYQKEGKRVPIESWLDAFILGDVYVLGFGYDLSEFDLWWLLNRKKREKAEVGRVYFYEISEPKNSEDFSIKSALLEVMGTKLETLGMTRKSKDDNDSYRPFYQAAVADIAEKVK